MSEIIEKAKLLATQKHAHLHLYNAARTPAIHHLAEVAGFVQDHGGSEDMVVAAWLHDIVEDTDVTLTQIEEWFGSDISILVDGLTDPPHFSDLPLSQRKPMQAERLKAKSAAIKKIKVCDQLSNTLRVIHDPPVDWNNAMQFEYIKGAREIVNVCYGVCVELDELFDTTFEQACRKYKGIK